MAEAPAVDLVVYLIDDDPSVRDALSGMLRYCGYRAEVFADAESFLSALRDDWAGCVVADLRLPGLSGIELQRRLQERGSALPVVIITAHGDVAAARRALLAEAVDFIEKPFEDAELREAIERAFGIERRRIAIEASEREHAARLSSLTTREREVLDLAATGLHAKQIAAVLGISPRTAELHKQNIMEKLGLRNIAQLVRFALGPHPRRRADDKDPGRGA
jgi:FixJ family two-component response regulator